MTHSAAVQYCKAHLSNDYRTLQKIIKDNFPDYYEDFINVMEHNNKIYWDNMFIMKYDDFVKYCEWLFAVLSIFEKERPAYIYNDEQQKRFFVSERLWNVYISKHRLKAKQVNMLYYADDDETIYKMSFPVKLMKFCKRLIFICLTELNMHLTNLVVFLEDMNMKRFHKLFQKTPPKP